MICGSSVGSIVAAIVATRTEEDMSQIFEKGALNLEVFESSGNSSSDMRASIMRKLQRLMRHGVLMDIEKFQVAVRANIGDLTFQEAYEKTGRVLNITVVSSDNRHGSRLLNYLTAPHVLVWSGITSFPLSFSLSLSLSFSLSLSLSLSLMHSFSNSGVCELCPAWIGIPHPHTLHRRRVAHLPTLPPCGKFAPVALMARDSLGNIVPFYDSGITFSDVSLSFSLFLPLFLGVGCVMAM